ncbi:uncharacterized protein Tco025E_05851 [Trypanosoma conorhini]|uniref:Uncharacterized protein n=1 Tax=Trypanosoma conorhini TaxID=83891 RepID=A0A422P9K7_9TRYP|nr:uncharacterized protein Tco025E_05851 [Trypanosoma conorhini]RNF14409.1 hypothetical protein Tco025E_05851 [Trypanosoma conorhini]
MPSGGGLDAAGEPQRPHSAAFWAEMEAQSKKSLELKVKIETFCRRWCPGQTHLVPFLAVEFCGREEELEALLLAMYGHSLAEAPRASGDAAKEEEETPPPSVAASVAAATATATAACHSDSSFMKQAVALSSFFGLGRHFVPAVYAQTKHTQDRRRNSWGVWRPKDEQEGAAGSLEKEEELSIEQTVLFEVLATLFPDFLCEAMEEGNQRTAFLAKRLATFLAFHEPDSSVRKYFASHNNGTDVGNMLRSMFVQHYASLIKEYAVTDLSPDDLDELASPSSSSVVSVESAGGGEDAESRRRRTKTRLRDWAAEYGLSACFPPIPSRSCPELHDVAVDTGELTAAEKMGLVKSRLSRTERGTMTQAQLTNCGVGCFPAATRRLYGVGRPLLGGARNVAHTAATQWRQNWVTDPGEYTPPTSSIVLETSSCQKCRFLEAQLTEAKAALQHVYSMAVANEEKQFDNEASYYAKQEQFLSLAAALGVDGSSLNNTVPLHLLQTFHECVNCKDLRLHIKSLEQKLRESYDNHRELLVKMRRGQLSPPPHLRVILPSVGGMERRSVSTMTELTGEELDTFVGYMFLESL